MNLKNLSLFVCALFAGFASAADVDELRDRIQAFSCAAAVNAHVQERTISRFGRYVPQRIRNIIGPVAEPAPVRRQESWSDFKQDLSASTANLEEPWAELLRLLVTKGDAELAKVSNGEVRARMMKEISQLVADVLDGAREAVENPPAAVPAMELANEPSLETNQDAVIPESAEAEPGATDGEPAAAVALPLNLAPSVSGPTGSVQPDPGFARAVEQVRTSRYDINEPGNSVRILLSLMELVPVDGNGNLYTLSVRMEENPEWKRFVYQEMRKLRLLNTLYLKLEDGLERNELRNASLARANNDLRLGTSENITPEYLRRMRAKIARLTRVRRNSEGARALATGVPSLEVRERMLSDLLSHGELEALLHSAIPDTPVRSGETRRMLHQRHALSSLKFYWMMRAPSVFAPSMNVPKEFAHESDAVARRLVRAAGPSSERRFLEAMAKTPVDWVTALGLHNFSLYERAFDPSESRPR